MRLEQKERDEGDEEMRLKEKGRGREKEVVDPSESSVDRGSQRKGKCKGRHAFYSGPMNRVPLNASYRYIPVQ